MTAQVEKQETLGIRSSSDIVLVRQTVRNWAAELGFGLVDQTKIVTASSEIARNTLIYGGGGTVTLEIIATEFRQALRLTFIDKGTGIRDIDLALKDGYTTGGGLGMGLGGAKRLMSEFAIDSNIGEGTRVTMTKWK